VDRAGARQYMPPAAKQHPISVISILPISNGLVCTVLTGQRNEVLVRRGGQADDETADGQLLHLKTKQTTHTKPRSDGKTTAQVRARYLSEK
jgi:hypothetical protein